MSNVKPNWATRRDELADRHSDICYCAGFTCSGCGPNTKKLITLAYNAAMADVIALAGAFDEVAFETEWSRLASEGEIGHWGVFNFSSYFARWQHQQLKAKLGGDT